MPQAADFDTIDKRIKEIEDKFLSKMPEYERFAFENLKNDLGKLETYSDGRIKPTAKNRATLNGILRKTDYYLQQYLLNSNEIINAIPAINEDWAGWFREYFPDFKTNELYAATTKYSTERAIQSIQGTGLSASFREPLKSILQQNITSGGRYKDLTKQVEQFIVGTNEVESRLARYSNQIVHDTLQFASRDYITAISNDLGIKWYYYIGTEIKTTRPFCQKWRRKYIHKSEFESITKPNWDGKIPGTNASNFQTYVGGFNCRHKLMPVSESEVPKDLREKFK